MKKPTFEETVLHELGWIRKRLGKLEIKMAALSATVALIVTYLFK